MLLLERKHIPFEDWFISLFRQGLLPEGNFSIAEMRKEYLSLCWKEETLWKEWNESCQTIIKIAVM